MLESTTTEITTAPPEEQNLMKKNTKGESTKLPIVKTNLTELIVVLTRPDTTNGARPAETSNSHYNGL